MYHMKKRKHISFCPARTMGKTEKVLEYWRIEELIFPHLYQLKDILANIEKYQEF